MRTTCSFGVLSLFPILLIELALNLLPVHSNYVRIKETLILWLHFVGLCLIGNLLRFSFVLFQFDGPIVIQAANSFALGLT